MKDFIKKNKSLFQKIGIGLVSFVIIIMVCLSPNIIKNLKGNVSSIDASTNESVKNEVFVSTSLKSDENSMDLNVYNYENKDIVITKIEYRNICKLSNTDCTNFSEFDVTPVTVLNNNSQVVNVSNIKDKVGDNLNLELGVRYTLDGKDYIVTTNTFAPVAFDSSTRNTLNNEQTAEEFSIYGYTKSSDWESNDNLFNSAKVTIKLTDNNVHMETTEKLSDFNLKYQMSSSYLYAWYIENPFKETTYNAKMLGLDNYSNFRDYFDYSYPTDTQTGRNGFNVSFDVPGNTPKATVTNKSVIPTFFWYLGAKLVNTWKWQHTSENGNIYTSDKVPQFKLTVYNKDSLKTAIENSLSKLNDKNSLSYNNESYFTLVNEIENAKRLYSGRNYYNKCDTKGNNCVKTDVNQEQIDSYVSLLNNYEVSKSSSANYSKYNNIISKVESVDKTLYETDSYNNMMSVYGEKENYTNLLEGYQVRVDNYVDRLQEAYDNLVMLDADYTEVDKIIDNANKISNVVNENDELYTKDSWNALQNAINSVDRTLKIDKQSVVDGYVKTIQSAIDGLIENPAKYTTVDKIIEDYKNNSNYVNGYWTSESRKIVDDFIATKPVNKKISEQLVVDNWAKELSKLMDYTLEFINAKGYVDSDNYHPTDLPNSLSIEGYLNYFKTEIAKKINDKNLYTDDTITKINNVINDYYDKNGNWKSGLVYIKIDKQSEMDKLIKDMDNIKNNSFVKNPADYTKLKKIQQEANNLVRDNYKDLTDLDAKLKNANELSDKLKLDEQDKIDKVVSELEDAISKLELKDANYEELNKIIEEANNLVRDNYKDLTDLDAKLKTAKEALKLKIDKQTEVDKAASELKSAISKLELKDANYTELNKAIEKVNNLVRDNYKDLTDLDAKLKTAKEALKLKIDKQSEVDKATIELQDAISKLELKDADYSKINDFKTNVYDKLDSTKYTNFDTLVNAMNNIDYSIKINEQEKVNEMYNNLIKVYNNLIKTRADYSKVELAINNAKKYEANKYNYTNYDEVEKLINSIDYNLDWGSQDKVDKYAADINYAISNLNKKLADYSKLAKVLSKLPADYSKYSSDIQKEIKEYLDEVKDLSTDLRYDEQDIIDEIVERGNILLDKLSKIKDYDDSIKEDIKNDEKTTTTKKVTIKKNSTRKNSSNKSKTITRKTTVKTTASSKNNNEKVIKYIKINDEKIEFTDNKINLNVDFSVEKADVVVKLQNDEDKYEVYGGEVLMPGINTVTIIVTRKNGTTYRYDINIKRPETSNYLSNVEIKNSSIKFDKNKNNYTINVDKDTDKLDLIAELEDKNATMKITGNSNLKNGSKVEIKVTDTKGNTNTYVITVKKSDARYIKIIIIFVALLSALTVVYKLVQNKKRN